MGNIFISYRREDSAGHTGRLFDRLREHFGKDRVFMDIAGIEPGVDFVEAIERAVGSCDAFVVVIGKQWLNVTNADGRRRLDNPEDFIRLELATALRRNIRVIPVLVQGAAAPGSGNLPEDLKKLSRLQAHEISDNRWDYDVGTLIETLEKVLKKEVTKDKGMEEGELQPIPPPPPSNFPRWAIAVIAAIAIGIGVYAIWPPRHPSIEMPNVVGERFEKAKTILAHKGLSVSITEKQIDNKPPGTVVDQRPEPGTKLRKGNGVDLVVAVKSVIKMPNVIGRHIDEAKAALREAGLAVPEVRNTKTNEKSPGIVLKQTPTPGIEVEPGQNVLLEVAVKPGTSVPNVVGEPVEKAKAMLVDRGLAVSIREKQTGEKPPGTVLDQNPRPGKEMEKGQRVELVIASEPAMANEQRRVMAKKLAEAWYTAYVRKDVRGLVRIASSPFFFDNEVLSRVEDIENRWRDAFSQMASEGKDPKGWHLKEIKVQTIAEWKKEGYDVSKDRFLKKMEYKDDDFMIRIHVEKDTLKAGQLLYTRNAGGQIKLAGFWD